MYIDIYQKFHIIAWIVLVSLILLNLISRQKRFRYVRHLKRQKILRFRVINDLAKHPVSLPEDLSAQELAGALILIAGRQSVSQSVSIAITFSDSMDKNIDNEEFYSYLFSTAKRFQNAIWIKESLEIMTMGMMLAKHYKNAYWQNEYQKQIQTLCYYRTGNATTYASDKSNFHR